MVVCRILPETRMKMLIGTTRSLRVITVALIGLTSFAVLSGCAMGAYPTTAPALAVAFNPADVAYNSTTNLYYVSNRSVGTVSVLDGATNTLKATVTVGGAPSELALNEATNTVYVINSGAQSLSVINGATNTVATTVSSLGSNPFAVVVNPTTNKVYIASVDGISVLNGATNGVIRVLPGASEMDGLAVNPSTNTVYVSSYTSDPTKGGLTVIDGASDTVTNTVNLPFSWGVAVDATNNTAFISTGGNDSLGNNSSIALVNGKTLAVTATVQLGSNPAYNPAPQNVAVNQKTHMAYVASVTNSSLIVVDGVAGTVVDTIHLDGVPSGIAVGAASGLVYVAEDYSQVAVINAATDSTTLILGK